MTNLIQKQLAAHDHHYDMYREVVSCGWMYMETGDQDRNRLFGNSLHTAYDAHRVQSWFRFISTICYDDRRADENWLIEQYQQRYGN